MSVEVREVDDETAPQDVTTEIMAMVGLGLLKMSVSEQGDAIYWLTERGLHWVNIFEAISSITSNLL